MKNRTFISAAIAAIMLTSCACGPTSPLQNGEEGISKPKELGVKIKQVLPHSRQTYTQGLEFHDGMLLESSGEYGVSFMERRTFPEQKVVKRVDIPEEFFAEGITVLGDTLYMLTWRERAVLLFDPVTFKQIGRHKIYTEGWGITNDGERLYISDGSQYIYEVDPLTFNRKRRIAVSTPTGAVFNINELEWIEGKIWANVYGYNNILIINPSTGEVEAVVKCDDLLDKKDITATTDVMNGIAYDPVHKKIYVTGKNWPKMFEIEVN